MAVHPAPDLTPGRVQLAEPGDGQRRYPSSGHEVDARACPGRVRVPCVDLVQRNEANNPKAHGQARKADGEAIALDAVPSPQQAPDDQDRDHDRDGDARRNLQASAVFVPAPLLEDAAQEVSKPAQQAEAARRLHQGQKEKHGRQSGPDQCVGAWQAVVMGPSASNSGPQAEQAGDQQCRDTQDIVRHCSSRLEDIARRRPDHLQQSHDGEARKTTARGVPVEKQTGKDGKQRKMAKPKLPVDAPLGEQSKVPLFLGRILALLDAITVAAGQQRCERYDSQYAHALISGNSATLF